MEKDLFGESSVEEDSSDDEFSKPVSRDTTATTIGVDRSESGGSSSSPTSSDVGDNSVSGDDGDGSVSGKGGDNSVSGDEGVSGDGGDDNSVSGDVGDKSVSGDEGATPPPADDSQFPSTQDLFGTQSSSDSSDSETEKENTATPTIDEDEQSKITKGIFGELADMSSSDDDDDDGGVSQRRERVQSTEQEGVAIAEEVPRIDVEIPRCLAKLGTDQYFVKLPNFLSVDTRPFDASLYEDEMEEEGEFLDEDGRARLKLKVENTIRWRKKTNSEGIEEKETNARIVQWTDGSMSLYLGSEIFDIHKQPLHGEYSHLFVRQGTGLQGQAVFKSKLTFRPHSTDSQTHRKMTLSIADRFSKAHQKIRVLPVVDMNPESRRSEMIKQEEQRLRACMKMDSQQRRKKEKQASKELTSSYLQPKGYDDYDDEESISISAIKTSVKSKSRSRKDSFIDDDSDGIGGIDGEQDNDDDDDDEEEEMEEGSTEKTKENSRKRQSSQEGATVKAKGRKLVFDDDDSD